MALCNGMRMRMHCIYFIPHFCILGCTSKSLLNWYCNFSYNGKRFAHVQGNQPLYSLNLLLHFLTVQLRSLHFHLQCIYTIWNRSIRYMLCFRKKRLTAIFVNVASGPKYPTRIIVFSLFSFSYCYTILFIFFYVNFEYLKRLAFASLNVSYILFERRRNK